MSTSAQLVLDSDPLESSGRDYKVVATRNRGLLFTPVHSIQHADAAQLIVLQRILQHGDTLGKWVTADAWVPSSKKFPALLSIDLRQRIVHFLPAHLQRLVSEKDLAIHRDDHPIAQCINEAVLKMTRYLILLRLGPVGRGKRAAQRALDPNLIISIGYSVAPIMFALAIASSLDAEGQPIADSITLRSLRMDDLAPLSENQKRQVLAEWKRMQELVDRGLWTDAPNIRTESISIAMSGAPRYTKEQRKVDSHQPLPDEYVSKMGRCSLWLMRVLFPNLLNIGKAIGDFYSTKNKKGESGKAAVDHSGRKVRKLLSTYRWYDQDGQEFDAPPFPLRLPRPNGLAISVNRRDAEAEAEAEAEVRWPPKNHRDVMALLGIVQMAHYFIVSLSMGARQSEVLGLQRECVVRSADGRLYANGKTYKLVQQHEGEWRDWQLPEAAVEALAQQALLVETAEHIAYLQEVRTTDTAAFRTGTHLWGQVSAATKNDPRKRIAHINPALRVYANALGLSTEPGGQSLRSHRFRKTLARLVALALTQAPKLLMDVFGHKSIEMTLYYILSDKNLRAEIETVARELRVMRAKEVVERMVEADLASKGTDSADLGGYGGLAAVSLQNVIRANRDRVHRQGAQWGANDVGELAELLTLQGKAWEQVRTGVLCTKFPGEFGPCSNSKGRPEPSKCQISCTHRLEEAFLREDIDSSIHDAVAAYESAISNEESLTAAHWAAQVRAHVPRFADLQAKWMLNETVRALVGDKLDIAAE